MKKPNVPTDPADLARINAMFNDLSEFIGYLYERWQDEKEYEDIADYEKVITARLPEGFTLTKMMTRPFGFRFVIGTANVYQMTATARELRWSRLS